MSNSGAWGPTPAGVDLSENQNGDIIASVTVVTILALAAVGLRLFARLSRRGPGLGVDDYAVIAAVILGLGNAACCIASLGFGGGYHLWVVTLDQFTKLYQTTYAFVIVYIWSVTSYKMAILLFYRRVFGTTRLWYIVFGFALAHGLEVTITWLSGCRPVSYYWRQYTDPTATGSCINASVFYLINGVIGLAVDLCVLLTPIPTIWKLQMEPRQKVAVCGILLLGSFVCVASIVRIAMMDKLVNSTDFTWAMCQVFIWSCVEPSIGIVCACLPTYAPLVRRWTAAVRTRVTKNSGATPQYYVSNSHKSSKREWSKIKGRGPLDATLPADDEVELAPGAGAGAAHATKNGPAYTYQVGTSNSESPEGTQTGNEIVVTKDFSWTRSV